MSNHHNQSNWRSMRCQPMKLVDQGLIPRGQAHLLMSMFISQPLSITASRYLRNNTRSISLIPTDDVHTIYMIDSYVNLALLQKMDSGLLLTSSLLETDLSVNPCRRPVRPEETGKIQTLKNCALRGPDHN